MIFEERNCICEICVAACKRQPGIFAPGEAEKAADLLGMPFDQFKKEKLIESYMTEWSDPHFLMPRKIGIDEDLDIASDEGTSTPGRCVFLVNERCQIHAAKPIECRSALLCEKNEDIRYEVVEMWRKKGLLK